MQAHSYYHAPQQRPYQSSSHSPYSSAYSSLPPASLSPSFTLPSYPSYPPSSDELDVSFTDHAMLMLSDSELPPMQQSPSPLPMDQQQRRPSYTPQQSSLPSLSPVPSPTPQSYQQQHYSTADRAEHYTSHSPHPTSHPSSPSPFDPFPPPTPPRGPLSPHSPRTLYPAHTVHAIPPPSLQLRSSSANTSPRAPSSHIPSYPSYPSHPYPAVAIPHRQTTPPQTSSSSSSPSSGTTSPSPSSSQLLSIITSALSSSTKAVLPTDDLLHEVGRQLGYAGGSASSSPLVSPRQVQGQSPQERRLVRVDLQTLASLLLGVAVAATGRGGSGGWAGKREGGEVAAQATAIPAMSVQPPPFTNHPALTTHRASLPALLPSTLYPPAHPLLSQPSLHQQFTSHTSRSRSKSRRRTRHSRSRHRSATPGYEGVAGGGPVEGSGMSVSEDVVDRLGELSFDEGEPGKGERGVAGLYGGLEGGGRVEVGGRRRSLSANRQSSRDRSLSVKRKRDARMEGAGGEASGYYEGGAGGEEGVEEEGEEEVSPYDSDDDSVEEEEGMQDDASMPPFPLPPFEDFAFPHPSSSSSSYPAASNTIFSPLDSFASPSSSSSLPSNLPPTQPPAPSSSSTPSVPKRKPGRPSKPGGPARPRPRTVYSPLTEGEERQRRHVKAVLHKENLTQSDLAKMCGVSKASMCTWLQGSTSGAMHSKIWGGVMKWMAEVDARDRAKSGGGGGVGGGGGGGEGREEGEEGRGPGELIPISPGTTSSSLSSSSASSSAAS